MKIPNMLGLVLLLLAANNAYSCSPPAALSTVLGPNGAQVPYQEPSYFAFLGKIVGHTKTSSGDPALAIEVLDAWTSQQENGETITIGVAQWKGCYLDKPMGKAFQPKKFPIGTRVRIVSREKTMFTWDVNNGISVLSGVTTLLR